MTMTIAPDEYLDKLVDMSHIQISCMVQVTETNQIHCQTGEIRLLKPQLNVQVNMKNTQQKKYDTLHVSVYCYMNNHTYPISGSHGHSDWKAD